MWWFSLMAFIHLYEYNAVDILWHPVDILWHPVNYMMWYRRWKKNLDPLRVIWGNKRWINNRFRCSQIYTSTVFFTMGPHMRDLGLIPSPYESYWRSASFSFWQKSRKLQYIHGNTLIPEKHVSNTVSGLWNHVQGDLVTKPLPKYTSRPDVSISALYILIYPQTFLIYPYMFIYPGGV